MQLKRLPLSTWWFCEKYVSMASWVRFSASGSSTEVASTCLKGESSEMEAGKSEACCSTLQN